MTDIVQIGIPKPIADEVYKIIGVLGYHSLTEFCVTATREKLDKERWRAQQKINEQEEAIVKKHEEGGELLVESHSKREEEEH